MGFIDNIIQGMFVVAIFILIAVFSVLFGRAAYIFTDSAVAYYTVSGSAFAIICAAIYRIAIRK
jgi:hypothetical protein